MKLTQSEDDALFKGKNYSSIGSFPKEFNFRCACHICCRNDNEGSLAFRRWITITIGRPFDTQWVMEAEPEYRASLIEAICLRAIK